MQGIYVEGERPKSKKAIKEAALANGASVYVEATSVFNDEYSGEVANLPEGSKVTFVGPDPYTKRNFYGTIERRSGKVVVK